MEIFFFIERVGNPKARWFILKDVLPSPDKNVYYRPSWIPNYLRPDEGGTRRAGQLAERLRLPMALIHRDRYSIIYTLLSFSLSKKSDHDITGECS